MNRIIKEPVIEEIPSFGGSVRTRHTHPAFAQIGVARVSGKTNLYGSDFEHNGFITLTIATSKLERDLSSDWYFDDQQLIKVAMSESQWATLVSSLNVGSGVPCTLEWLIGEGYIPELPTPSSRASTFGKELQRDFDEAIASLDELRASLESSGLPKKKIAEFIAHADRARRSITSSAPYVVNQFDEHMENQVEKAKGEIHGYAMQLMQQGNAGQLLDRPASPISLGGPDHGDD